MSTDSTIKVYSIYALIHPDTGKPYYVGKTCDPRQRYHHHLSYGMLWLTKEIVKAGKRPEMVILQQHYENNSRIVELLERAWISRYRDQGCELINVNFRRSTLVRFKYADRNDVVLLGDSEIQCE